MTPEMPAREPLITRVFKKRDDPITPVRVSIGSVLQSHDPEAPAELIGSPLDRLIGFYCVYRGTKEQAIDACLCALRALRALPCEPDISSEDGKRHS